MPEGDGPYALSEVLAEELDAIQGGYWVLDAYGAAARLPEAARALADHLRADAERQGRDEAVAEAECRRWVYTLAHGFDLTALCLSGGGIRSAAISLGVIQALVDGNLLQKFNYLSTVSGGGYIGSWLSAWLHNTGDASAVLSRLGSRRNNADAETPPLAHLRDYSNYLTPKVGLFSADTWAAFAIVLRNMVVNWLILVPALALLVIGMKLLALLFYAPGDAGAAVVVAAAACLVSGGMAFGYKLGRLYAPPDVDLSADGKRLPSTAQRRFLCWSLTPALLGGFCFVWLARRGVTPADGLLSGSLAASSLWSLLRMLVFAVAVYVVAIFVGFCWATPKWTRQALAQTRPFAIRAPDVVCWLVAVVVFAVLVWLGARTIWALPSRIALVGKLCGAASGDCVIGAAGQQPIAIGRDALVAVFGVPWFLMTTTFAHSVYLLLRSRSGEGEVEREWLGRASGWHFIAVLAWLGISSVVLLGPAVYYHIPQTINVITVVSGAVTRFLGKSGLSPATGSASDWKGFAANIGLAIAGPVFAALLLVLLSVVVDWSVLWTRDQCFPTDGTWDCATWKWGIPIAGALVVLLFANSRANVNAFSLHAVYRNRLIRAFLGGARNPHRWPDGFTDFDWDDELRVASLWRRGVAPTGRNWRPLHVINMTLNLAATNRLAWQQRKASAFSVTPFKCGNADLGYRSTDRYGGPYVAPGADGTPRSGIALGTAMAVSGAAVSSNMGYHSSMSLSFLLTFFNVRLGVWLGNPGGRWQGENAPFTRAGPAFAVRPLLSELFGLTTDQSPYVYLSDGGHFEDLGLYEMVRRRCKWIVVVDGDQDGGRGFADLGNAVRKIWIDLGIRIDFEKSPLLGAEADAKHTEVPFFALGTVCYISDPMDENGEVRRGKLLYIKPIVRGDENAADVIAYKRANPDFPAQSTARQWFDESQFESYRRLGHLMAERLLKAAQVDGQAPPDLAALFAGLEGIDPKTMERPPPVVNVC